MPTDNKSEWIVSLLTPMENINLKKNFLLRISLISSMIIWKDPGGGGWKSGFEIQIGLQDRRGRSFRVKNPWSSCWSKWKKCKPLSKTRESFQEWEKGQTGVLFLNARGKINASDVCKGTSVPRVEWEIS